MDKYDLFIQQEEEKFLLREQRQREYSRKYCLENREKMRKYALEYYYKNREKCLEYARNNKSNLKTKKKVSVTLSIELLEKLKTIPNSEKLSRILDKALFEYIEKVENTIT